MNTGTATMNTGTTTMQTGTERNNTEAMRLACGAVTIQHSNDAKDDKEEYRGEDGMHVYQHDAR